jgi:hypothetical protein
MIRGKKGQESGFKTTLFAFILIALFGMLILTAVVNVGDTYSKDTTEVVGGSLSINKFNDSISSIEGNAKSLKERFDKGSIWSAIAGVVVEGIFGIAKDMVLMILYPFDILTDILIDTLHIPAYVTSVLLGLLILGIILAIWRIIKIGD